MQRVLFSLTEGHTQVSSNLESEIGVVSTVKLCVRDRESVCAMGKERTKTETETYKENAIHRVFPGTEGSKGVPCTFLLCSLAIVLISKFRT